jgi:hypothetical protein
VHVARRDHPDQGAITAQREGDVQRTPIESLAEGVEARLLVAVPQVFQHQQGLVEEDLFGLGLRHAVLLVLAGVTVVPVEADDAREIDHSCTLSSYTRICESVVRRVLPALWEVHHTQPDVQRVRSVGTILSGSKKSKQIIALRNY